MSVAVPGADLWLSSEVAAAVSDGSTICRSFGGHGRVMLAPMFAASSARAVALMLAFSAAAAGQSTQGVMTGRVFDARSRAAIPGAKLRCTKLETGTSRDALTGRAGTYTLLGMSPGSYHCRAESPGAEQQPTHQPREIYNLELPVAGRAVIDFPLRDIKDVYDQGVLAEGFTTNSDAIVHVFAADVRTTRAAPLSVIEGQTGALEAAVSQVIDGEQLRDLPLAGRDVYALLITQPGVTADAGTSRSLGLSANGQRPSASNFLLDGLEHNNSLVSGPLTTLAPEAIQEYRISTTMYSAEYGRTAGYLANAITRAGTTEWHGLAYGYLQNDVLNANDFQRNRTGLPRNPVKEVRPGFYAGGPIGKAGLFASSAFEHQRFRSFAEPEKIRVLTDAFRPDAGTLAAALLQKYPSPFRGATATAELPLAPSVSLDRSHGTERLDYVPSRGGRFFARVSGGLEHRPDLVWTPYEEFRVPLWQASLAVAGGWSFTRNTFLQEFRLGWTATLLEFNRPHPEVPTLLSFDGTMLPGSPALYSYRNRDRGFEIVENLGWVKGNHLPRIGGGILVRRISGYLTIGGDRIYGFDNIENFRRDLTTVVYVGVPREAVRSASVTPPVPDYDRRYGQTQFSLFAQDIYRLSRNFVVNYGLRYENFGAPVNHGAAADTSLVLAEGDTLQDRLRNAQPRPVANARVYDVDTDDLAVRAGFSWSVRSDSRTLLRGGYGVFHDRPFDNLWANIRNNAVVLATATYSARPTGFLRPATGTVWELPAAPADETNFSRLTLYQPGMRSPYVQNMFLGLQHQISASWSLSLDGYGSLGRKLITTDVLNRDYGFVAPSASDFYKPDLPPIYYRANQGASSAWGLGTRVRWRGSRGQAQAIWTWSHSIDNQSEPLAGDFYNLDFVRSVPEQRPRVSAFTRQFDSSADRGNSDYDQRHALVLLGIWHVPAAFASTKAAPVFRNWKVSELAAFRSGLPYTVFGSTPGVSPIFSNRADLVHPAAARIDTDVSDEGGRLLLNRAAFAAPGPYRIGTSGRNAFRAPGFYNIDLSVSRPFAPAVIGERARIVVRADFFNLLNHANLGAPNSVLNHPQFGLARYGRTGLSTGFPASVPFQETARRIQLMLRFEF
jgi:hypothetical protein